MSDQDNSADGIGGHLKAIVDAIHSMPLTEKVEALNNVRSALHAVSPFRNEPVDFVRWVANECVIANDYNPNVVAKPEMDLLHISIREDGYTQPIVAVSSGMRKVVVDGFHRHRVGKERADIRERVRGYLPVVEIDKPIEDRMASTIRHNRARGKHKVDSMGDLVRMLVDLGLSDETIAKRLGMEGEEVLRLRQTARAAEALANRVYARPWDLARKGVEQ